MNEKTGVDGARNAIRAGCVRAKIYKHNDRGTKGMPDSSVTWCDRTWWLEFKMLNGNENIHNELDPLQLVELVRLERSGSTCRAWVVAYRKATRQNQACLTIYRPTALVNGNQPVAREFSTPESLVRDLAVNGVALFEGHNHGAVVTLIQQTR